MKYFALLNFITLISFFSTILSAVEDYGVDITFPIHGPIKPNTFFGKRYYTTINGCYDKFTRRLCESNELARMEMNLNQPRSQHNYTEIGFKKIRVPDEIWGPILEFYNANKDKQILEQWPKGNTYVNSWTSPTSMISFENRAMRGGIDLKTRIWDIIQPIIEEWVGKKVIRSSLYGIREYKNGAILATHVDRLPLVSSCIIQVAQDILEPWPIEVYSHDGKAHNITMLPGDLVLYESHTVLHGRPFPLNGSYYANIFVHYVPIDHDDNNNNDPTIHPDLKNIKQNKKDVNPIFLKNIGGHEQDNSHEDAIEKHLKKHDNEVKKNKDLFLNNNINNKISKYGNVIKGTISKHLNSFDKSIGNFINKKTLKKTLMQDNIDGRTALHIAAMNGNIDIVEKLLEVVNGKKSDILYARDINGWQAIHEAARANQLEVLVFLIESGADIGALTNSNDTVLSIAIKYSNILDKEDSPIVKYLKNIGAPNK